MHFKKTANDKLEEGGDDVKSSWPLWVGLHMCYNGIYKKKLWCESVQTFKKCLSPDCSLQLESMKSESLVIVDQHATVNMSTGFVHTARHAMEFNFIWNNILTIFYN